MIRSILVTGRINPARVPRAVTASDFSSAALVDFVVLVVLADEVLAALADFVVLVVLADEVLAALADFVVLAQYRLMACVAERLAVAAIFGGKVNFTAA
jgi:hypothetical protein